MKKKNLFLGVLLASAAVGLAACSGNGNTSTTSAEVTTPSTTTATTDPSTTPDTSTTTTTTTTSGDNDPTVDPDGLGPEYDGYVRIRNVDDFNAFRENEGTDEKFVLTADIDLAGVTLEGTKNIFFGTFDGNGHTIKNAMYKENAANKSGILTRELHTGAVITNVKFSNCTAELAGETIGIITGMAFDDVEVSKVEFSNCCAKCNNYAGLIIGRTNNKTADIKISEITCKNGTFTQVSAYGGTLIGDIAAGTSADNRAKVSISDCDLDIELKGANKNGGFLSGRIRNNTNLDISNVLIRSAVLPNGVGLVCGGGDNNAGNSTVTVKNLYVASTNATLLQSCAIKQATNPVTTFAISYDNSYMAATSLANVTDNEATYLQSVDGTTTDINWMKDTLKLDFSETGAWTAEEKDATAYRLKDSSTNVKSADAKITEIKLTTANAQVRFEKGTDFNTTGLAVTGIYSDGVNLPIKEGTDYEVDATAFNKDAAGQYEIVVKSKEDDKVTAKYTVEVVAQTAIDVDTQFAKLAYVPGEELDLSKLLVYATWTDGSKLLTTNYETNADSIDMTTAGAKELTVTMAGFDSVKVRISVVDTKPVVVDNYAYVCVDASANVTYAGERVNGVETFTTINEAVEYLVSADLGADVNKVLYIANGTYFEKITIPASLKNLKIIGESRENTIIEYDAVEDTMDPVLNTRYVMNCATLHVNAEGFGLENITVRNSFDYIANNTKYANPQGFALTIAADGAVVNNVTLYGNQDTLFFKKGRVYLKNSEIDGNIDFIFGENDGIAFFDTCTIVAITKSTTPQNNNGYVTAMKGDETNHPTYGYVFYKCTFTDDGNLNEGSMSLGRPWGPGASVAMINCSFTAAYSTAAYDGSTKSRWFDMSGNSPLNAHFVEYGSDGLGAIKTSVAGGTVLSETEAGNYTAANTLAQQNGGVKWSSVFDYQAAYAALAAIESRVAATGILVLDGSTEVADTYEVSNGDSVELVMTTKEFNAINKEITVEIADPTIAKFENGKLYGLSVGNTTMTVKCGNIEKVIALDVIVTPSYAVHFVTSGTTVDDQEVYRNKTATKPTTTKEGSVFKGWFTDDTYATPFDFSTPITDETYVYARFVAWSDMYKENIVVYFNQEAGDNVDTFTFVGKNGANADASFADSCGIVHTAKLLGRPTNGDSQFNNGCDASIAVEKYATIILTVRTFNDSSFTFKFDDQVITPTVSTDGLTFTYETTKAGVFHVINDGGKNAYLSSLSVTYPEVITRTTRIDFGSDGNYKTVTALDQSAANYGQEQAKCNQILGDLVFYVAPGAVIDIAGNWSVGYSINGVEVLSQNAGGADDSKLNYSYTCTEGGKVVIHSLHNNNYFYSITVTVPAVLENSTTITFGSTGNYVSGIDGVIISGAPRQHDETSCQFKNQTITINLKAAAKVTFVGNWAMDFSIGTTEFKTTDAGGSLDVNGVEYNAEAGQLVITIGDTGACYIKSIQIEY